MCPDFLPGNSGGPPLLAQCVNLVRLYYATVQNLIYGYENVPQITAESIDTPPIHCVQQVQQYVEMSIQLPQTYIVTALKWLKLFNRSTYLSARHILYSRVNVVNTVHLSKRHSYCLQCQNKGANTGFLSAI